MLKVYQAQDFGSYECKCVEKFEEGYFEEYYDTHIFCTTHQQWWENRRDGEFGPSAWVRVRETYVPDVQLLMMATSDNYRMVEVE